LSHERQQIRDAVVAQLIGAVVVGPVTTYATAAGARVYKSRQPPVPTAQLPAIGVYTDSEEVDPASKNTAPRELKRMPVVAIEGWVSASGDVDDACDDLALEIETAMDADDSLDGCAFSSVLSSTEIGLFTQGNRPMACVRLEYSVVYHTDLRVADPVDDFDTMGTQYSLSNEQAALDQASDLVEDIHE